jgi:signal transduction histidine kinase
VKERLGTWLNSLTAKYVAVFTVLVAVPAIGISWYLLDSSYNDNKQALISLQEAKAQALAMTLGQSFNDVGTRLKTIQATGLHSSQVGSALGPLLIVDPTVSSAFYLNANGRLVNLYGPPLHDPVTRREFQAARRGTYFGPIFVVTEGDATQSFMDVASGEGSGLGVVGEVISPASVVQQVLSGVEVSRGMSVFVADSSGRSVSFPDQAFLAEHSSAGLLAASLRFLPQVKTALGSGLGSGSTSGSGPQGKVLSAWATVAPTGWKVFVEQPESAAFAPLSGKIWKTALLIAAFVAAAVALSILLARRLVRPIKRMQVAAEAIGAGAYDERIDLERKDELGALAKAFNAMAEHVQELIGGLERTVAERTRQLESASRHKSEFLANMSHELRTPLNAILGFTQVLQQKLFGDDQEKQEEYLADIHSSAGHLLELINDVLDLSKVEAGQVELEKAPFSLRDALERGVVMVRERATQNGVQLTLEPDPSIEVVTADERRVRQVLFNLLSNAVKFTPAGGSVDVTSAQRNGEVLISVKDTGPGIAAQDQERIFEEFQQTDVGAEVREGTGLGLALSKKLVELHGGRIWVDSEPGQGATFTFTLPLEAKS